MQVTPVSKTLAEVFRGSFLRIPRFQRPYSWDKENLSDFWYDLIERPDDDYFMGSMVIYKDGKENNLFYIVDGQQRLTTIAITLAVLRDALDELGEADLATGVHNLIESKDLDNKPRFVVEHDEPNPYFQQRIQQRAPDRALRAEAGEQTALRDALTFLANCVRDYVNKAAAVNPEHTKDASRSAILRIRNRLLALQFISIELTNEDDAYLIFETLNTRGKDLQISDLVKNLFNRLIKIKTKGLDTVKDKWSGIMTSFNSVSPAIDSDTFLAHYWLSTQEYVSKATLFKEMKSKITQANASAFLDSISSDARLYTVLSAPGEARWQKEERELKDSIQALTVFRVAQVLPLGLSIFRLYRGRTISLASAKRAFSILEKFTFQFNAIAQSRGGGGVAGMYAKLAQEACRCQDAQAFANFLAEMKVKLEGKVPEYDEFRVGFARILFTSALPKDRQLVRYILRKFAERYGLPSEVDGHQYTIEHIKPESDWSELEEMFAVGHLGNLLFVSETVNQELDVRPFAEKKAILLANNVPMDPALAESNEWDLAAIERRTLAMSETAYNDIWKI